MKTLYDVRKANDPVDQLTGFINAIVLADDEDEAVTLVREETELPEELELYAQEIDMTNDSEVLAMTWSD